MSDSSRPHGLQPTRLLRPWDFPGKSTGVGCHCLQDSKIFHKHSHLVDYHKPNRFFRGLPDGSAVKNPPANAGDSGLIHSLRRSPGEGNGNPLQYFLPAKYYGQRNLTGYSPWGCKESDTTQWLNNNSFSTQSGQSRFSFFTGANKSSFWFASIGLTNAFSINRKSQKFIFTFCSSILTLSQDYNSSCPLCHNLNLNVSPFCRASW